jgi:predicted  nucleic acid-binding Zn-ribbon protein
MNTGDSAINDVAAMRGDLAAIRSDVASLKTEMGSVKTEISSIKTDVGSIKVELGSVKTDVAVSRERGDQHDKRFQQVNLQFTIYSSIIGIFLAIMGWGIWGLNGSVNANTAAISRLDATLEERSKNLAEKIEFLSKSFGDAPARLSSAAVQVSQAADKFVANLSTLNATIVDMENAAERINQSSRGPFDAKAIEDQLEVIKRLLHDLKDGQGKT